MYARTGGAGNNCSPYRRRLSGNWRRDGACNLLVTPILGCSPRQSRSIFPSPGTSEQKHDDPTQPNTTKQTFFEMGSRVKVSHSRFEPYNSASFFPSPIRR